MKVNLTIRFQMMQLEIPDHLDPKLHNKQRWRTTWGGFSAVAGPSAVKYPGDLQPFVSAAKQELAAIIAEHGVDALSASVQIAMEPVPKE